MIIDQNNIRYPDNCFLEDSCFNIGCIAVAERIGVVDAISFCNREHRLRTSHQRNIFYAMPYSRIPFVYIMRMVKEFGDRSEKQQAFYGEILCLLASICCVFSLKTDEKERKKIISKSSVIVRRLVPRPVGTSAKYLLLGKGSIKIRILQIGFVLAILFKVEALYIREVSAILDYAKR